MTSKMPESTANRGAVPPRKVNPLAAAPDVQLVLTQLRILAGINHFDANFLAVFTTVSEKESHAEWKRTMKYEQLPRLFFFSSQA